MRNGHDVTRVLFSGWCTGPACDAPHPSDVAPGQAVGEVFGRIVSLYFYPHCSLSSALIIAPADSLVINVCFRALQQRLSG